MNHSKQTISATELARNLASVIDQVRVNRTEMTITRGTQAVAKLVPATPTGATLDDLERLLSRNTLSRDDRRSFSEDLQTIRESSTLPDSPWEQN